MSIQSPVRRRPHPVGRTLLGGFAVGFVATFVVAFGALASSVVEGFARPLVPGAVLLSPWSDTFADWNVLATMLLTALVNGAVYAAVAQLAAAALRAVRQR